MRRGLRSLAPLLLLALLLFLADGAGKSAATASVTDSAAGTPRFLAPPRAGEPSEAERPQPAAAAAASSALRATSAPRVGAAVLLEEEAFLNFSLNLSNVSGCNDSALNGTNGTNATNTTGCNTSTPVPEPSGPVHVPWIRGTWTTGYWDCCKPSCAWPGKGKVNRPMFACSTATGEILSDSSARSVCDGGTAASCHNHQPFLANQNLAMGFAAAAVSGHHGLTGDDNCGQCFELKFAQRKHGPGVWGGAHPKLVNKSMVLQVTNIGMDVNGAHSFDIQIPGAGQGLFTGCARQYPGFRVGDFDCDHRYGGCDNEEGCSRLPKDLQPGCRWRYNWFRWLREGGQTNNPWVEFRRVRCPVELTDISGSTPEDDHLFKAVVSEEYV